MGCPLLLRNNPLNEILLQIGSHYSMIVSITQISDLIHDDMTRNPTQLIFDGISGKQSPLHLLLVNRLAKPMAYFEVDE